MRVGILIVLVAALILLLSSFRQTHHPAIDDLDAPVAPPPTPAQSVAPKRVASPRLPAPRMAMGAKTPEQVEPSASNSNSNVAQLIEWIEKGGTNRLSAEQVDKYLAENQRSASSLLAAYRTNGDKELLKEALENFPNDPQVNFTALYHSATPEERQQRIDALKQAAPDNALANYLAAQDAFKAGNADLAVQELLAANGKSGWQDYSRDFIQSAEEAYRSAGYSDAEAKALAASGLVLPHFQELRDLGRKVNDLAVLYQQSGDAESALAARQIGIELGLRLEEPSVDTTLLRSLVGFAIQNQILAGMDPASAYGDSGRTVKDELDALKERRAVINDLAKQSGSLYGSLTEQELVHYFDRMKSFGEVAAIQWLVGKQKR